jgi:N-terminal domain of toast_rack, DUF2154
MPDPKIRARSTSVVWPLLLIGFGALMLLWRWLPNFYPWGVIGKYWPLLFICIGAGMVWDRTRWQSTSTEPRPFPIGSTIGTLVFIAIIALLIQRDHSMFPRSLHNASAASTHETKTIDIDGAKAVRMTVEMPSGELVFQGGSDHLLSADFFQDGSWEVPKIEYSVTDGQGNLKISQEGNSQFVTKSDNKWNLRVDQSTPLDLKVDVGAGRGEFHLANVDLTNLELNIGAGQVELDLTGERAKDLRAEIQGGVGQAVVRLPRNIGVIANVHGGLGSIDVHGLKEEDGKYVNAAYGKSPHTIHLTVEGGIGQIKLDQE